MRSAGWIFSCADFFPFSPCGRRWRGRSPRRMRGLSPRIETPHPAPSAPPSPTRGEGAAALVARPLLLLPVVQQPALALGRMRAQAFLVRLGAPAGTVGDDHVAVDILRHMGEELVIPGQTIDVGLHDA